MNPTQKQFLANSYQLLALLGIVLLSTTLAAQAEQYGDFTYSVNGTNVTITAYTGTSDDVVIPGTITNLPVTSIGDAAFSGLTSLTGVTIPDSVTSIGAGAFATCGNLSGVSIGSSATSIGDGAFSACSKLTSVTLPHGVTSIGNAVFQSCTSLTNATLGNSVTSIGLRMFRQCISLTSVTLGNSVTSIGVQAFYLCSSLTTVTIPSSVTSIGNQAFHSCSGLTAVYCKGNAPTLGASVFDLSINVKVYYLPGTTGWGSTFGDRPTAPWYLPSPAILTLAPYFGVQTNQFGFRVSWATNAYLAVEACTNLITPAWSPASTNTLTNGWFYFSDPDWTNYPARFYRLRSP